MSQQYGNPPSTPSTVGNQLVTQYFQKKALIELVKEKYFGQLADVTAMPKNHGKKIVRYHYLPLLDERNINDQGIDASGVTIDAAKHIVTLPSLTITLAEASAATAAAAAINAIEVGVASASAAVVTVTKRQLAQGTLVQANAVLATVPGATSVQGSGNLYGSSKDIGAIPAKMPLLSETGGRVNRVGFKRKELEGSFEKYGFFQEYTQASLDFDSDEQLAEHVNREMLRGANEITEDLLQIDLLNAAGTVRYAGVATSAATVADTDIVTYGDLMRLGIDLDNNRTPKKIKMITGTRMVDTKTIMGARALYVGSELIPTLRAMKDLHNEPAFVSIEKYAAGGETLAGEIGAVDQFRVVVVPEMMKWAGAGAATTAGTVHETGGKVDVFPMLVVGDESFTTIGFQTDGNSVKFTVYHKKPGEGVADKSDPYGETGFMSIKWFYGFMALRPERIGLIKTAALL